MLGDQVESQLLADTHEADVFHVRVGDAAVAHGDAVAGDRELGRAHDLPAHPDAVAAWRPLERRHRGDRQIVGVILEGERAGVAVGRASRGCRRRRSGFRRRDPTGREGVARRWGHLGGFGRRPRLGRGVGEQRGGRRCHVDAHAVGVEQPGDAGPGEL